MLCRIETLSIFILGDGFAAIASPEGFQDMAIPILPKVIIKGCQKSGCQKQIRCGIIMTISKC